MYLTPSHIQPDSVEKARFRELVYTPLDEAVSALRSRQPGAYLSDADIPAPLLKGNCAVLFRFVASPNHELLRFVERARAYGLYPIVFEYHSDKFVTRNHLKYALGKLGFYDGCGKKGGLKHDRARIIDFNACDGKRFSEIVTVWNEPLISFHHRLLFAEVPHLKAENLFEASEWLSKHGGIPRFYYEWLFSLMLSNAILFETYLFDSLEAPFIREVILPAFCAVTTKFGLKPLVTSLDPPEREGEPFWAMYPARLKRHIMPSAKETYVE